jgi:Tripartite tricarboxylate transporter TctB family
MRRVLGTNLADALPPFGLLILTIGYLIAAYQYPPASRAFPLIVAWSMLILVSLDLVSRTQTRFGRALTHWLNPASAVHTSISHKGELAAILWIAAFAAALLFLGILAAIPLFVFTSVRWRGERSYALSAALAAGTTLTIWLLFARLLRIELYPGVLFGGGG